MSTTNDDAEDRALVADFVGELVGAEDNRRQSLEARGTSVITLSGTVVTLLLWLAALVTGKRGARSPRRPATD